jgi:hypothetical protein
MPHFGLMSTEDSFKKPEGALLRARLHIRGGKRRLGQGKVASGIVTLYDALVFALRWYFMDPGHRQMLNIPVPPDLNEEREMMRALRNAGVIDTSFDLEALEDLVDKASHDEMKDYDYRPMLDAFESLMTRLGVMPFDEALLPPEDPSTF